MKKTLLFLCLLLVSRLWSQVGLEGGFTMLKGFGTKGMYPGLHIGLEIPKDDQISFFGRLAVAFPKSFPDSAYYEARDYTITPSVITGPIALRQSVISLMGGNRYYLGSGYDYGFSAYGGTMIMLQYTTVKLRYDGSVDPTKYVIKDNDGSDLPTKGGIFGLSFGLNAGVKNHFSFGMLYFDLTLSYALLAVPNNTLPSYYSSYSPLQFSANIGFRKDLY